MSGNHNHNPVPGTAQWWAEPHHPQPQQPHPNPAMEPVQVQPIFAIPIRTWHPDQPQHIWLHVGADQPHQQPQPQPQIQAFLHDHNNNQLQQQQQPPQEFVGDFMKEDMFEKILTPSDVGKLNRLVIPRNHAEEHLPPGADEEHSNGKVKGLLVSFEDETGKHWEFRYSYWKSSQSYVLTKGWTRYVKDNELEAGDIVVFQKHRVEPNRLFISCRRRPPGAAVPGRPRRYRRFEGASAAAAAIASASARHSRDSSPLGAAAGDYPAPYQHMSNHPLSFFHAGEGSQPQNENAPIENNAGSSSDSVWLFGVNLNQTPPGG